MPSHPTGPFTAFRIADDRFPLLDGGGAFKTGGRWNSKGRHVVYAGIGFATSMLEKLAHTRIGKIPNGQHFAEVFIPGHIAIEEVGPSDVSGWTDPDYAASRAYGDAWYDSRRSAVLVVPRIRPWASNAMCLSTNCILTLPTSGRHGRGRYYGTRGCSRRHPEFRTNGSSPRRLYPAFKLHFRQ